MSINQEIKQMWVEKLRSGDYKQGTNALRNRQDEFCCLGVLCDIVHSDGWKKLENSPFRDYTHESGTLDGTFLTGTILKDVGLSEHDASNLVEINDMGDSFVDIANYIEKYL